MIQQKKEIENLEKQNKELQTKLKNAEINAYELPSYLPQIIYKSSKNIDTFVEPLYNIQRKYVQFPKNGIGSIYLNSQSNDNDEQLIQEFDDF